MRPDDDFPDGGLRAWLVILGVCSHLSSLLVDIHGCQRVPATVSSRTYIRVLS
jgi:hypothetical protein